MQFFKTVFRKSICSFMAFTIGFTQAGLHAAAAQSIADQTQSAVSGIGKEANAFGKELGSKATNAAPTFDGTTIRFKAGKSDIEISKDSLAPADNGKNIRYSYTADDFEKQKELYNDDEKMREIGSEQKDTLFTDSESDSPTLEGEVYAILVDMAKRDKADYTEEAFLEKTLEILGDMDNVLKDLVTCDANSALDTQFEYKHIPDYKECQQVVDRSTTCTINHDYTAGIIEHADGPFNIKSCGEGCTELWIGKIGDNYWCGTCQIHEEWTQVLVHNPEAVLSATLDYVKWDDYMMVYVGKPGSEQLVWTGPYDWRLYPNYFPPETPGKCELSTSWSATPSGPVANCTAPARCPYGGMLKGGTSTECDCNPRPDCNEICDYGGVPKKDGTQSCSCRAKPDCNEQCVYGGTPLRDGTQACRCLPNPNPKPGENPWTNLTLPWTEDPLVEPPDPVESDEEAPDSEQTPGVDVTQFFKGAQDGDLINFKTRVSVSGCGEGYGRIRIRYDPEKIVSNDLWKPKDCVDAASGIDDGFAQGEIKCVDIPEVDSSGCVWINGAQVCERHLNEPPMASDQISRFCRRVSVKTDYNFYKGDTGCWKALVGFDANGKAIYEEVCGGENIGGNLDTCAKYKEQGCKFVSAECTPEMTGASGTCYVNDVVYDCGKDVKVDTVTSDTTYDCKGISCLGEECIDVERTYSTDFAKINALLNAVQYMAQDMACSGLDENGNPLGDQNVDCTVFGGTEGFCKIAVGGWQDCCEDVGGPGVGEYIAMIQSAQSAHAATMELAKMTGEGWPQSLAVDLAGQYADTAREAATVLKSGMEYLGKSFSSVMDNLYGAVDYLSAPFKWFKEMVMDKIKEFAKEVLTKILEECGFGGVVEGGGAAGAGQMASQAVGTVIAVVGWVYLAYQVANLVIKLVYKCEESEYETISKRDAKNCHYVGSYCKSKKLGVCIVKHRVYCCFQSPLSRIVNEQIKATQPEILAEYGNDSWGDPKHPNCGGIPLGAVTKINWDLINLDEWTALLVSTGNAKTADGIDIETLTGAASHLNWTGSKGTATQWGIPAHADGTTDTAKNGASTMSLAKARSSSTDRKNVIERTQDKLAGQEVDELRIEGAKCLTLVLGNGVTVRGGCGEETNTPLVCRKDGLLFDCEEIAYMNSLGELLGNKPSSSDYWNDGYRCMQSQNYIDCSTLYSKDSYIRALEEYARIIGGTTYLNRYVCLDKSGKYTQKICEHAMEQNYCLCLDGMFQCQDGNKIIACAALGSTKTDCECMSGACLESCKYGGTPSSMLDNALHVCTSGNCPYGYLRNGADNCNSAVCPYGR